MKTYPCVVGNRIVELTEEQRAALEWRQMSSEEKIAALLARIEDIERAGGAVTHDALRRSPIRKTGEYAPAVSSNGAPKALYEGI